MRTRSTPRSECAHPGDRARRRRTPAVPLSSRLGRVREQRKARRLARLAEALPRIRRAVRPHLARSEPTRDFALAAVVELVALQRHTSRQRESTRQQRHARRGDAAQVERLGRRRDRSRCASAPKAASGSRRSCVRARLARCDRACCGDCPAAACSNIAATTACVPGVRAATSTRSCASSPACDFAQGFPHAARFRGGARRAGPHRAGTSERDAARGRCATRCQAVPDDLGNTPAICARATCRPAWSRRSSAAACAARPAAGGRPARLACQAVGPAGHAPRRRPDLKTQLQRSVRRLARGSRRRGQRRFTGRHARNPTCGGGARYGFRFLAFTASPNA